MNKKVIIPAVIVGLLLLGGIVYLAISLNQQKQANKDMQELAELDKKEMENEYQMFADQYSELKTQINNDSIIEQLTQEQLKTEKLLEELRNVKASVRKSQSAPLLLGQTALGKLGKIEIDNSKNVIKVTHKVAKVAL